MKSKILATLITVSIFLAACSPAAPTVEVMMDKPTEHDGKPTHDGKAH